MELSFGSFMFDVAAIGFVCAFVIGAPASASASASTTQSPARPTVTVVTPTPVAPGTLITARLVGWPTGTATVGVCGNNARRGSEDCSLVGDVAIAIRGSGATLVDLTVVTPPVPCPCVVRASESGNDLVQTTPIALLGVASGPALTSGAATASSQLDVRTAVESDSSWVQSLSRSLAGPSSKTLVVTLHNQGTTAMKNLRVVTDVGRNPTSGSPLAARTVARVAPGEQVTLRVPLSISAPAFGSYTVSGTVYGLAAPESFAVGTSNDPWALELAVPIALLAAAQLLRRRDRKQVPQLVAA